MKVLVRLIAAVAVAYTSLHFLPFWAKMAVLTALTYKAMK
mgnify:CR=1 FL=1